MLLEGIWIHKVTTYMHKRSWTILKFKEWKYSFSLSCSTTGGRVQDSCRNKSYGTGTTLPIAESFPNFPVWWASMNQVLRSYRISFQMSLDVLPTSRHFADLSQGSSTRHQWYPTSVSYTSTACHAVICVEVAENSQEYLEEVLQNSGWPTLRTVAIGSSKVTSAFT